MGYARDVVIRSLLSHYKEQLEDLTMEELEEELYAEEETTIPPAGIPRIPKEPTDAYEESIKVIAEDLVKRAREKGFKITPIEEYTRTPLMMSKWRRHEEYMNAVILKKLK